MVNIKDGCGCDPCDCNWKQKLEEAYARASVSINKITDQQGSVYYPDGSGNVQIPIPTSAQIAGIGTMTEKLTALETGLKDETAERKAKDSEITGDLTNANVRITANADDITAMKEDIATVKGDMKTLSDNEVAQNADISALKTQATGITESLVSDVSILDGATTGTMKVRIDRRAASPIDSDDYNLGRPVSAEIVQGTGPSMFKMQITLSSGVTIVSNDFVFTTEAIGQDVYISSFTFKAGNQDGYLSADIGLNNGVTIEANNFLVPTDPNVLATINNLGTRLTTAENDITANMTEIADLKTSKVSVDQGTVNTGKVLGINALGQVEPVEGGSGGGEVWEELDLSNLPTDFSTGDRIRFMTNFIPNITGADSSSIAISSILTGATTPRSSMIEVEIGPSGLQYIGINYSAYQNKSYFLISASIYAASAFNSETDTIFNFAVRAWYQSTSTTSTFAAANRSNISNYIYKMWRLKK